MATDERPRPDDPPTGLPDEAAPEEDALGPPHADPDGEGESPRGPGAMPGIPEGDEPPAAS